METATYRHDTEGMEETMKRVKLHYSTSTAHQTRNSAGFRVAEKVVFGQPSSGWMFDKPPLNALLTASLSATSQPSS